MICFSEDHVGEEEFRDDREDEVGGMEEGRWYSQLKEII